MKGETASGFVYQIDENVLDNMELVDALAEAQNDNPITISRACELLLGKETRAKLYDHLRTPDGRVPIAGVSNTIIEIFKAFGEKGKN